MKFVLNLILLALLTSCASGTWSHHTGNNNSYSRDAGYCKSLARSQFPGYICRNPLMCAPDETNKVLDQIIQSNATIVHFLLVAPSSLLSSP